MSRVLRISALAFRCEVCGWAQLSNYPRGDRRNHRPHVRVRVVANGWWCLHCIRRVGDPRQLELGFAS